MPRPSVRAALRGTGQLDDAAAAGRRGARHAGQLGRRPTSLAHPLGTLTGHAARRCRSGCASTTSTDGRSPARRPSTSTPCASAGSTATKAADDGAVPARPLPGPHRGRAADAEDVRVAARRRPHRATGPDEPGRERCATFEFEPINLAPLDVAQPPPPGPITFPVGHLGWHVARGQAAASPLRQHVRLGALSPDRVVDVRQPPVAVVDHVDLAPAVDAERRRGARRRCSPRSGRGAGLLVLEAHELVSAP